MGEERATADGGQRQDWLEEQGGGDDHRGVDVELGVRGNGNRKQPRQGSRAPGPTANSISSRGTGVTREAAIVARPGQGQAASRYRGGWTVEVSTPSLYRRKTCRWHWRRSPAIAPVATCSAPAQPGAGRHRLISNATMMPARSETRPAYTPGVPSQRKMTRFDRGCNGSGRCCNKPAGIMLCAAWEAEVGQKVFDRLTRVLSASSRRTMLHHQSAWRWSAPSPREPLRVNRTRR